MEVFQVCLDAVEYVAASLGRSAKSAYLSQSRNPGLQRMPMPILAVNLPEQLFFRRRSQSMGTWSDQTHLAEQHIDQLRQFINARLPDECAHPRYAIVVAARG